MNRRKFFSALLAAPAAMVAAPMSPAPSAARAYGKMVTFPSTYGSGLKPGDLHMIYAGRQTGKSTMMLQLQRERRIQDFLRQKHST